MRQIKGGNVRKQIINAVMVEAMDYFKEHQQIKREDIQDFQVMGKSFSSGLKKKELLDELSSFTQFVIYSRTYNGVELQGLIKDVFQDSFCYNLDSSSKSNLSAILEICKDIILRSDDEISSVDRISLADLVDKIAHIAIEKNYETVFNQSFDLLKKLPDTDEKMFKICKKNYSIERYDLIQRKIINLSNSIRNTPIYSLNEHKIRHVLCYLSWFHSGLEHMKYFTDQRITELKVANILTSQVLTDAITYFQNKGDYKSAHSINELRKDYFSESEQRNK